jgi:hypothetical protein
MLLCPVGAFRQVVSVVVEPAVVFAEQVPQPAGAVVVRERPIVGQRRTASTSLSSSAQPWPGRVVG